jgi:hypothetical protein
MRDVSKHASRGEEQTRNLFLLSHRSTHERSPQSKSVNSMQLLATKTGAPAAASASARLRSAPSRTASPTGRPRYRHDRQLVTGGWHGLQGHAVAHWRRLPRSSSSGARRSCRSPIALECNAPWQVSEARPEDWCWPGAATNDARGIPVAGCFGLCCQRARCAHVRSQVGKAACGRALAIPTRRPLRSARSSAIQARSCARRVYLTRRALAPSSGPAAARFRRRLHPALACRLLVSSPSRRALAAPSCVRRRRRRGSARRGTHRGARRAAAVRRFARGHLVARPGTLRRRALAAPTPLPSSPVGGAYRRPRGRGTPRPPQSQCN